MGLGAPGCGTPAAPSTPASLAGCSSAASQGAPLDLRFPVLRSDLFWPAPATKVKPWGWGPGCDPGRRSEAGPGRAGPGELDAAAAAEIAPLFRN